MYNTGTAAARMQAQCMDELLHGTAMTVNKLAKPARKVTWELRSDDEDEKVGGSGETGRNGDTVPDRRTVHAGGITENKMSAVMIPKDELGEPNKEVMPVTASKQVTSVFQSKALTQLVANYEAVAAERLLSANPTAAANAAKDQDLYKEELATLEPTSSEQLRRQKATDWAEFQRAMKPIHARKTTEEAAEAARIAKIEVLDGERFAAEQAEQTTEKEWELLEEFDAVEKFEEISEQDAVDKYVVVELTPARNINVRRTHNKARTFLIK